MQFQLGANPSPERDMLGFAILKDRTGRYFMRFGSQLNRIIGKNTGRDRFSSALSVSKDGTGRRQSMQSEHVGPLDMEPRDLPLNWARLVESIVSRDLNLGRLSMNTGAPIPPGLLRDTAVEPFATLSNDKGHTRRSPFVVGNDPRSSGTGNALLPGSRPG